MTLPTDYDERKALPLWTFMFNYFPDAWLEVVRVSVDGNKQHKNTGSQIMWDRTKSTDQLNTAFRHQFDYGKGVKIDSDGRAHLAKAVWRLMAQLQLDIEAERNTAEMSKVVDDFAAFGSGVAHRTENGIKHVPLRDVTAEAFDVLFPGQTLSAVVDDIDELTRPRYGSPDDGTFPLHPDDVPLHPDDVPLHPDDVPLHPDDVPLPTSHVLGGYPRA